MSDHLAYDYDHSKATTSELIEKLHYLNDKGAIYIPSLPITRTQRKWKLIAQLERHYALQREHLNINVKDYLHLCHEKTYRNKITCPELRNILSQYDITYPDEPSRAQLLEVLDKNIVSMRKRNRCKEIETTRRKFNALADTRKEAETPRQDVGDDETDTKAIEEWILNMSNRSNDDDEKNRRKEVKETWAVWGRKVAKSRVSYAAMALVPWMILAAQVVAPNGATPSS
ncbi:hypothetical protein D6C86_02790 [Aureobasidium pullulans]|uniref:Uncharacterized protein n=1 Tax=Aureobasidium pullulans TaxID=5580 RepID=A0A4S9VBJ0_AURPU|nr:hypothetical protein D6C94_01395 [Aureobasidium pullulans]THZ48446.1 hypothetical protein D6C87_00695 [Aureobasidium pullulans]THZ63918.1 hypothetical protein D6C86_02790 [Aureobasidium pullulans]THZ94835.1 hypothetical protein D6C88_02165 [Aureobasidium pullulans]